VKLNLLNVDIFIISMAQNFYIRKNSNLPILMMKLINDGRNDYKKFFEDLESSAITFSMTNLETGRYKIFNKQGLFIPMEKEINNNITEYYLAYKFTNKDTDKPGVYRGEFKIDLLDQGCSIITPIYEDLIITILDSQTNSKIVC
jgi:hypothetical protein